MLGARGASRILRPGGAKPGRACPGKEQASHILSSSKSSPLIELRARQLRARLEPSEELLWSAIRGGRLGVCFRRQVPIGRFIVDFLVPSRKLAVEVDGNVHKLKRAADARRDASSHVWAIECSGSMPIWCARIWREPWRIRDALAPTVILAPIADQIVLGRK